MDSIKKKIMSSGRKYYIFLGTKEGPIPLNKNLFKSTVEKFFNKSNVTKIDIRHTQGNKYHAFVTITSQRLYRAILKSNTKYIVINGGKWNIYNYVSRDERSKKEVDKEESDDEESEDEEEYLVEEEKESDDEEQDKESNDEEQGKKKEKEEEVDEYKSPYSFLQTKQEVDAFESIFKEWSHVNSHVNSHITLGNEVANLLQWCLERHVFL